MTPAFKKARLQLRDLVSTPVAAWMALPPARRSVDAYRAVLNIGLDLSSAGYLVTTTQTGSGWSITIEKQINDHAVLHIQGEAISYAAAWFQISDQIELVLSDLEARAKRAARELEAVAG